MSSVSGVSKAHADVSTDVPQIQVEVDLARPSGSGSSPGTSAGPPPPWWPARRSATCSAAAARTTSSSGARRARGRSVDAIRALPIDTPSGQHRPAGRRRRRSSPAQPERDRARGRLALPRRQRRVSGATSGRRSASSSSGSTGGQFPRGLPRRDPRRVRGAPVRAEPAAARSRSWPACRPAAAAGVVRQLAARRWSSSSPCRWPSSAGCSPRWLAGGIVSLGSLVGFFTVFGIAARNGILLVNHCQHLEREEGEAFGAGAGAPRGQGTAGADPHDLAGHRPRARPARRPRRAPGPRDRVPARRRHPRRPRRPRRCSACSSCRHCCCGSAGRRHRTRPAPDEQAAAAIPLQRITEAPDDVDGPGD